MIEMCQNTQCIVEYLSYNFHCDVLQNWILRQSCLHLAIAHTFHLISYGPAQKQMLFSLIGCYSRYALLDLFAFLQLRESTQTLLKRVGKIPRRNCKICSKGCSGGHQCVYFRCDCWKDFADQRGKNVVILYITTPKQTTLYVSVIIAYFRVGITLWNLKTFFPRFKILHSSYNDKKYNYYKYANYLVLLLANLNI